MCASRLNVADNEASGDVQRIEQVYPKYADHDRRPARDTIRRLSENNDVRLAKGLKRVPRRRVDGSRCSSLIGIRPADEHPPGLPFCKTKTVLAGRPRW
jgi:hypothetical protein